MIALDYCDGRVFIVLIFKAPALRTQASSDLMLNLQAVTMEELDKKVFLQSVRYTLLFFCLELLQHTISPYNLQINQWCSKSLLIYVDKAHSENHGNYIHSSYFQQVDNMRDRDGTTPAKTITSKLCKVKGNARGIMTVFSVQGMLVFWDRLENRNWGFWCLPFGVTTIP